MLYAREITDSILNPKKYIEVVWLQRAFMNRKKVICPCFCRKKNYDKFGNLVYIDNILEISISYKKVCEGVYLALIVYT